MLGWPWFPIAPPISEAPLCWSSLSRRPSRSRRPSGTLHHDHHSLPCGPGTLGPPPNSVKATHPTRNLPIHTFGQGFEATRLNTGTMTDLATLAATLRANFCSLHIPGSKRGHQLSGDWWATVRAMHAESLAAYAYRDRLRRLLVERGHHRFLHHLEADPAGGWRLHFFVADVAALTLLDELTEGTCGPGDPVSFNPKEFVSERLRHLFKIDTHS
jgi:hypothetical protein